MEYLVVDPMLPAPYAGKASKDSYLPMSPLTPIMPTPSSTQTIITTKTPIVAATNSSPTFSPSPSPESLPASTKKRERKREEDSPSGSSEDNDEEKGKKRHRRTAGEIERKHVCKAVTCGKAYGSEGALKMHIRLKHPDLASSTNSLSSPTNSSPSSSPSSVATPSVVEWTKVLTPKAADTIFSPRMGPTLIPHQPTPTVVASPKSGLIPMWSPFADPDALMPIEREETANSAVVPQYFVTSPLPLFSESDDEEDYFDFSELKEKYSHIPLLRLNIGLWQAESQCPGDLVAKFSYQERCITWEIFDVGSIMRTVVSFDELNGIGLELHPDDTATMVIELKNAPQFYKGILQPYSSTVWNPVKDFTAGMASTFRRHILHFSRRALNETIENIFKRDPLLQSLLLQGLPALVSPYFSTIPAAAVPVYQS